MNICDKNTIMLLKSKCIIQNKYPVGLQGSPCLRLMNNSLHLIHNNIIAHIKLLPTPVKPTETHKKLRSLVSLDFKDWSLNSVCHNTP